MSRPVVAVVQGEGKGHKIGCRSLMELHCIRQRWMYLAINLSEVHARDWWTPEQIMKSGLEGPSSLYPHDNILWDRDQPMIDDIETQNIPYGPNLPSDPSTPTNIHSCATSTPIVNSDNLSVILDKSEAQQISLAEGDINFDGGNSYVDIPNLQAISDSESKDWESLFEREDTDPETDSLPDLAPI
jgi:hypothetical protein